MVTATEFDELLDVLRDFIRREVMPAEAGIDYSDEIPARLIAQAKEMGLYGYALPAEYGGLGLSVEQQVRVTIELGYTSPAFRSLFGTNNGIAGQVLVLAGTEAQRKQWLPRLASGEVVASFALTEPDAGSDPSRWRRRRRPTATAGSSTASSATSPTPRRPTSSWCSRAPTRRHRAARASGCSSCRPALRGWRWRRKTTRWARPARGPPMSPSPACGSPARPWSARRRGRLRHRDEEPGARAAGHRGHVRGGRGEADRRERQLRQGTHPGRPPDRRIPAGPGHAGGLADRIPRGPGAGARRRGPYDAGTDRRLAPRRRSTSPARRSAGSPTGRSRSTAAPGTSAASRSSGCTATCGCSGSTKAPARSSSSSSPGRCSGADAGLRVRRIKGLTSLPFRAADR